MSECDGGCPNEDRRTFLRQVTVAVAAVMASLAATPGEAAALPLRLGAAHASHGDERTYPIPTADGATIDRDNEVILVRWTGMVYAFNLSCPHQHTALRWLPDDGRFQCPKHKSKYQPDGAFISGRATRNMDRFAIRKEGQNLIVDLDRLYQSDKQKSDWEGAVLRV
jgi:Rieske Fe-S protein